jgi:hypothetical protein
VAQPASEKTISTNKILKIITPSSLSILKAEITNISCVMPVSAMLMTGGVVFLNYFCGGEFVGGDLN